MCRRRAWYLLALELRSRGNIGIAFTYNEPTVSWEYIIDTAEAMKGTDLRLALVTNGGASPEIWDRLMAVTDAANIDLKAFTDGFYRRIGGDLGTVKRNIETAARSCHVELTTLIIPGENDSPDEIRTLAEWVSSVDPEIPSMLRASSRAGGWLTGRRPIRISFTRLPVRQENISRMYMQAIARRHLCR